MVERQTLEWRRALELVRAGELASAYVLMSQAMSPHLRGLAHLVAPGATPQMVQAALVPLERADTRTRITDADMLVTTEDRTPVASSPLPTTHLVLVADNIRSAFNCGGLFRTAEFFGCEELVLCGYTATPDHPQVARAALGSEALLPWRQMPNVRAAVAELRSKGYTILALETAQNAVSVADYQLPERAALLLGNERFGLDPDVVAMADAVLQIPAWGHKNSLNVVCAAAAALSCLRRT